MIEREEKEEKRKIEGEKKGRMANRQSEKTATHIYFSEIMAQFQISIKRFPSDPQWERKIE